MTTGQKILVLGGARSGKSAYAERLAKNHDGPLIYLATAQARDDEMTARIASHQLRRGEKWQTIEAPVALATSLQSNSRPGAFVLVDCVTLWLTNILLSGAEVETAVNELAGLVAEFQGTIVMVSNETGLGIVPENALARRFRDEAGRANQLLAQVCDEVVFIAAGLPVKLKP